MDRLSLFVAMMVVAVSCAAQEVVPFSEGQNIRRSTINQEVLKRRHEVPASPAPKVVVFTGDRVIAQFVDGASWQTSVTTVNLENHPTSFDIFFFADDGSDLFVPVVGQGVVRGMHVSLNTAGSFTFQTTGSSGDLLAGWALLSQSNSDSVGMFAIFRQLVPGRGPQEAVVPAVNQFESHFVLPFDNTRTFVSGIALANPTTNRISIPVNIRDETGQIIDTEHFSLGPYGHVSFTLPDTWPATIGLRGIIEFVTSGFGVGALGLRFNAGAFTSYNVLENFAWTQ